MKFLNRTLLSPSRAYWSTETDGHHRYATEEWFQKYANEILTLIPHGGVLLDVGCGSCQVTTYLAREFTRIYGVDMSPSMLAAARSRIGETGVANIELRTGTTEEFPAEIRHADAVLSYAVVQYLGYADFKRHLEECRRVLSRDGVVCVALVPDAARKRFYYYGYLIPNRYRRLSMLRRWMDLTRRRMKGFLRNDAIWDGVGNWYRQADIRKMANAASFDVEFRDAAYSDYRFHALLRLKSD